MPSTDIPRIETLPPAYSSAELPRGNGTIQGATFLGLLIVGVASRLLWHPENLTAVGAVALFGGMYFRRWPIALILPTVTLLTSDLILSVVWAGGDVSKWYFLSPIHYVLFFLTACAGMVLRRQPTQLRMIGITIATTVVYFLVSNFAVWYSPESGVRLYQPTMAGLLECYVAGLPFARNMLIGNLLYGALLLGAWLIVAQGTAHKSPASARAVA